MENCPECQILNKVPMNSVLPSGIASRPVAAVSIIVEQEGTGNDTNVPALPTYVYKQERSHCELQT